MSYNLKNKIIVMIALSFTVLLTMNNISYAEEADVPADAAVAGDALVEMGFDENTGGEENANVDMASTENADEAQADESFEPVLENTGVPEEAENQNDDFLGGDTNEEAPATADQLLVDEGDGNTPADSSPEQDTAETSGGEDGLFDAPLEEPQDTGMGDVEAPKSPFENFGNAILSKVDNDLFNQMSSIEKQNTLLNLELKREELKNKVEALRNSRTRAKEEEENRRRAEREKLKDQEAERQAQILAEQAKLKEKEIELEKVRQAKVLNEYMNEMLKMNQEWVIKNTELQNQIQELKKDRADLIKNFEESISQIQHDSIALQKSAEMALANHNRTVTSLNSQISGLKKSIADSEDRIKKMQENNNSNNPFAAAAAMNSVANDDMDDGAIDMSEEYAIMDITGHGDNIIAKIVNKEGTTFTVHKGSMLKGGEIVSTITDHYVGFEKNGVKSFIYTGGTVLEFEPTVAFNDSNKIPEETQKESIKPSGKNVLGNATTNDIKPKAAPATNNGGNASRSSSRRRAGSAASFGAGMFVQ